MKQIPFARGVGLGISVGVALGMAMHGKRKHVGRRIHQRQKRLCHQKTEYPDRNSADQADQN